MRRQKDINLSLKMQSQIDQTLEYIGRYEEIFKQKYKLSNYSIAKRGDIYSSLQKSKQKTNIFLTNLQIAQLKSLNLNKNCVTERNLSKQCVYQIRDHQEKESKVLQRFKTIFKVKKRKFLEKKYEKYHSQQIQAIQTIKNIFFQQQKYWKTPPSRCVNETSFHKSYKRSLTIKKEKQRYRQTINSNPQQYEYTRLMNRILNTGLLRKYNYKHRE